MVIASAAVVAVSLAFVDFLVGDKVSKDRFEEFVQGNNTSLESIKASLFLLDENYRQLAADISDLRDRVSFIEGTLAFEVPTERTELVTLPPTGGSFFFTFTDRWIDLDVPDSWEAEPTDITIVAYRSDLKDTLTLPEKYTPTEWRFEIENGHRGDFSKPIILATPYFQRDLDQTQASNPEELTILFQVGVNSAWAELVSKVNVATNQVEVNVTGPGRFVLARRQ